MRKEDDGVVLQGTIGLDGHASGEYDRGVLTVPSIGVAPIADFEYVLTGIRKHVHGLPTPVSRE